MSEAAGNHAAQRGPLLEVHGLEAFYGDFRALRGVSVAVHEGHVVAVIGANGAGKSTLLNAIAGLIPVRADAVRFDGQPIGGIRPSSLVARGIALVPEGRRLFASLNVEENLLVGGRSRRAGPWNLQRVFRLFPDLAARRKQSASSLSGGQQQMVAIARALMSNPRILLCDELSLGLAPVVVKEIYAQLPEIAREGVSIIVVEQDVVQAMAATRYVYCLHEGKVSLEGECGSLDFKRLKTAYFGVGC
jgi:branched-chain amino acid transport system ATP-binding protein